MTVDVACVTANDEMLDLLADRAAWGVADPAVALLRALTEEVDAGLEDLLAPVTPAPVPAGSRLTARGAAVALVVAATWWTGCAPSRPRSPG